MKKLLTLLITSFVFIGCVDKPIENNKITLITIDSVLINGWKVKNLKYDSCEYVMFGEGNTTVFTHKGNCKNKIHIYNLDTITFKK